MSLKVPWFALLAAGVLAWLIVSIAQLVLTWGHLWATVGWGISLAFASIATYAVVVMDVLSHE